MLMCTRIVYMKKKSKCNHQKIMRYIVCFQVTVPFIFAVISLIGSERPKFRDDYRYEKAFNTFYKVHHTAVVWSEALIRCDAEGTELMVPDSLDEADAVPLIIATILNKFEGVFIGIHDLYSERSFVTVRGSAMLDTILNLLWEYKEPIYDGGRCVAMRRTGRLFVHPCSKPLPFICKTKADTINFKQDCSTYNPSWKLGPNGTCYMTHVEPQTWYDAYSTCLSAGGHLAIINSRAESEYIRELYKEVDERRLPNNELAFLGYSDLFQRHHYRTVHGEKVEDSGYTDWDFKCPEENGNGTKENQRCGGMRRSGLLATGDCDRAAMFFCEKPANSSGTKQFFRIRKRQDHVRHEKNILKSDEQNYVGTL